jgi:hypothetical protein
MLILHEATVATALDDPVDVAFKKRLALPYQMTIRGSRVEEHDIDRWSEWKGKYQQQLPTLIAK